MKSDDGGGSLPEVTGSQAAEIRGDMNFEVNGQAYVLTFLPSEGTFALFEHTGEEVQRMKIVHDDGPVLIARIDGDTPTEGKPSLN